MNIYQDQDHHLGPHIYQGHQKYQGHLGLHIYQGQGQGAVRRLPALSPLSWFCKLTDSLEQGLLLLLLGQGKEFWEKFCLVLPEVCHIPEMFHKW